MAAHRVRALLMGGQACVFYGAAEFSRDVDLAVLAEPQNLEQLRDALEELKAEQAYVPPLSLEYLQRGHAVHFRCQTPATKGLRIDLMGKMRGVAPFEKLWERRTTVEGNTGERYELLALRDLVQAKKTQRDKDWPMIRRLLEADYAAAGGQAPEAHVEFWLEELRTPGLLSAIGRAYPTLCRRVAGKRPLLNLVLSFREAELEEALEHEEKQEREADRLYWLPLKAELEQLRHGATGTSPESA